MIKYSELAIAFAERSYINSARAHVLKGYGLLYSGKLESAVESLLTAADLYKSDNNDIGMAVTYISISEAYNQQKSFNNARKYLLDAVDIFRKENDETGLAGSLHNLGYTNYSMGRYDTALILYNETEKIYRKLNRENEYAICLGNKGLVYSRQLKLQDAEKSLIDALEILNRSRENRYERATLEFMIEYAGILQRRGEIAKGISVASMCYRKASGYNFLEFERDAANRLASLYRESGKLDSAFFFKSAYFSADSSINNIEKVQRIADMITKHEVDKKQAEVEVLENKKLIQLVVIIGLSVILALTSGLVIMYYYSLKRSRRLSEALKERQLLLEKQGKELKDQQEELVKQKEEIISSINYARYIQSALLPQDEELQSLLGEHFVLYKPKDIVSGDFYWISKVENITVVAAADCTGHGVPGAFMSMLGTALLDEIVNKEYITHTGVILRHLRKEVINSLRQKGERGEQKDGMDISLCAIDFENMKLQFSGAINPLYVVRKSDMEPAGSVRCDLGGGAILYEIKGDMMPIGISDKMNNFTFHEINIYKEDSVYLFTDGFPDQFGGPDNKKFGYRRLRELLLNTNTLSMPDVKGSLENRLAEWKGVHNQIDDILVIGFRI
jgi:serine phosphatase RsbU (regulator of sigma subunit)